MVDADILVSMHASDSGYSRYQSRLDRARRRCCRSGPTPFRYDDAWASGPIEDTMAAFVCHGVFTRFPDLRVASVENGGDWVVPFLDHLEDTYRKMPHAFDEDPIEAFKRNVWVSPFHEDDIARPHRARSAPTTILFGSDFPHPEGLAEPCSYLDHLPPGLSDDDDRRDHGRQPGRHHAGAGPGLIADTGRGAGRALS